jgi:hypothetical protein
MEQEAVLGDRVARIVEIAADCRRVLLSGGEVAIVGGEGEAERIPLDEIAGMVALRPGRPRRWRHSPSVAPACCCVAPTTSRRS